MTEDIKSFIQRDDTAKNMVDFAEKLGKEICDDVSTSQIRNAYGTVKKLQMARDFDEKSYRELLLLKPKLAYAKGRAGKREKNSYEKLEKVLSTAIDAVEISQRDTFDRFCNFFEAILAYHKAYAKK